MSWSWKPSLTMLDWTGIGEHAALDARWRRAEERGPLDRRHTVDQGQVEPPRRASVQSIY